MMPRAYTQGVFILESSKEMCTQRWCESAYDRRLQQLLKLGQKLKRTSWTVGKPYPTQLHKSVERVQLLNILQIVIRPSFPSIQ